MRTRSSLLRLAAGAGAAIALGPFAALRTQPCFPPEGADPACCYFTPAAAGAACEVPGLPCEGACFSLQATWWDPADPQPGLGAEKGVHLRWAFNLLPPADLAGGGPDSGPDHLYGLTFPRGGFEVQRRPKGATQGWMPIGPRIYPATDLAAALARIPSSVETSDPEAYDEYTGDRDCNGREDLLDLITVLKYATCKRQAYTPLWWIEGSDEYWVNPLPPDPEFDAARYDRYVAHRDTFFADHGRYPLRHEFKPIEMLHLAAVDPIIARILGLYYVDTAAAAGVPYDYRVLAHYVFPAPRVSHLYCAEALDVGSLTDRPLPDPGVPVPLTAAQRALVDHQPSARARSEMVVDLTWTNYLAEVLGLANPNSPMEPLPAGVPMPPSRYIIYRRESSTPTYSRLKRPFLSPLCEVPGEVRVPSIAIGGMPSPGGDPDDLDDIVWKEPPYYADNSVAEGKKYVYQVVAMDIFGRYSPAATSGSITIVDQAPPPAPIITEARLFQTGDPAFQRLPADDPVRRAVEATGKSRVLRLRWLWPLKFRASHSDLDHFAITLLPINLALAVVSGSPKPAPPLIEYPPIPPLPACSDGRDNDADGAIDLDDPECTAADDPTEETAEPPECSDGKDNDGDGLVDFGGDGDCDSLLDTSEEDRKAEQFEHYVGLPGSGEPVSEVNPGDLLGFLQFALYALDENGNDSLPARTSKLALRDVKPPMTPGAPALPEGSKPGPPDARGLSSIPLEWDTLPAEPYVTYLLYRSERRALAKRAGVSSSDDAALRDYAAAHDEVFSQVSSVPIGPFGGGKGSFADRAPAPGLDHPPDFGPNEYLYALVAMDPAGNRSVLGPLSAWILVPDGFPPARPVIARAVGNPTVAVDGDRVTMRGKILVEWVPNPELDIKLYRLYRTDEENLIYRASKRRMSLRIEADPTDLPDVVTWNGATRRFESIDDPPRPERVQYYRLEAEDTSGNVSSLSEWAAARTEDTKPPPQPSWRVAPRWSCEDGVARVAASWSATGDDVESRLLRRTILAAGGKGAWQAVTGWLPAGTQGYTGGADLDAELEYEFQVEARDGSGNLAGSETRVLPRPPDCEGPGPKPFRRGDPNRDGDLDISDVIFLLRGLFGGGAGAGRGGGVLPSPFPCEAAADVNLSGKIDISDAIYLLNYLFLGGRAPPPPTGDCGTSRIDPLSCEITTCP